MTVLGTHGSSLGPNRTSYLDCLGILLHFTVSLHLLLIRFSCHFSISLLDIVAEYFDYPSTIIRKCVENPLGLPGLDIASPTL